MNDLRIALRQLGKSPGFTLTVVITLALGISSCTLIFSIVNRLVLNPVMADDPGRSVRIYSTRPVSQAEAGISLSELIDLRDQASSLERVTGLRGGRAILRGEGEPRQLVATNVFGKQGDRFKAVVGRTLSDVDNEPGSADVVVLSNLLWKETFGGDEKIVGRQIELNDSLFTVVGVLGPDVQLGTTSDLSLPIKASEATEAARGRRNMFAAARLKRGVTLEQAQAELGLIANQFADQYPETSKGWGLRLMPMAEFASRDIRGMLVTLLCAVGCVLLIACGNIANLLFARANVRRREISIRAALGASRWRLLRQLLTESLVLSILGGTAGIFLASWGLDGLRAIAPHWTRLESVAIDGGILFFCLVLSLATGLLFGVVPSWLASRGDVNEALKQGTRGSTEGGTQSFLRGTLVVAEVAGAVVLLTGAGLFIRNFATLVNSDPGFVVQQSTAMRVSLSGERYAGVGQRALFADEVMANLRGLPGVESVAAADGLPILGSGPATMDFEIEGRVEPPGGDRSRASIYGVSPGFFQTMGIRLTEGRGFLERDDSRAQRVVIISEKIARQYFPGESPIGKRIRIALPIGRGLASPAWSEVVGVTSDSQDGRTLDQATFGQIYQPHAQNLYNVVHFVVRSSGDPTAMISAMKSQVYAVDPNQPVLDVTPLSMAMDRSLGQPRVTMQLMVLFSLVALVIACVGVYGVMAYNVSQRTTEIGIRMALGASPSAVLREVLRKGMKLVAIGLVAGLCAALAMSQMVKAMLYTVGPRDPITLSTVSAVLLLVGLLACWIPARRATKVDPIIALRSE